MKNFNNYGWIYGYTDIAKKKKKKTFKNYFIFGKLFS